LGFTTRIVGTAIGDASAIKMIRSVMVKGIEALSAECALAAHAAGVEAEVLASLDRSWKEQSWAERFDYNLDRMLIHGLRRAAEMEEVVKTLDGLGTGSQMTRGTVQRQRAIGAIGQGAPDGLQAKVDRITPALAEAAEPA
jgi:3-hydroxyisobutyrate dehydrogenase-like beta-hydroxyacid dehydrogenase